MLVEEYLVLLLAQLLLHDSNACNVRHCEVSEWSSWSSCSQQCSSGTQHRTRHKVISESCGGDCHYHLREERDCPKTCLNGATTIFFQCYCKPGYSGSCCQFHSRRIMKRDGNTKMNPPTQESSGTKCGTSCIAGISGGCCCTAIIMMLYFCWRKGCKEATESVINCICCSQGSTTVIHRNNQVAAAPKDSHQTPENPGCGCSGPEAPPSYTCSVLNDAMNLVC